MVSQFVKKWGHAALRHGLHQDEPVFFGFDHVRANLTSVRGPEVDDKGNAWLVGYTGSASFNGIPLIGGKDIFLIKINAPGTELWTKLHGSSGTEYSNAVQAGLCRWGVVGRASVCSSPSLE